MSKKPIKMSLPFLEKSNERLIREMHKYGHMYNQTHKHYRNRLMKDYTWKAIASVMECSVSDCQRRWKNLRDRYAREIRTKVRNKNNPNEGEKKNNEEWYLMDSLSFLSDQIKHRPNRQSMNDEDSNTLDEAEPGDNSMDLGVMETDAPTLTNETLQGFQITGDEFESETESNLQLQPFNSTPEQIYEPESTPPTQSHKKQKKDLADEVDSVILKTLKEISGEYSKAEQKSKDEGKLNADELFCVGIAAELKKMTEKQNSYTKMSIQKLLFDVKYGHILELEETIE